MNPIYKFEFNRESVNLVDPSTIIPGRLLDPGDGGLYTDDDYQTTARIAVEAGKTYTIKDNTNNTIVVPVMVFYEEEAPFAYSYGQQNVSQVTIPDGIGFIRFSFPVTQNARNISFATSDQSYTPFVGPNAYPTYKDDLAKDFEKESGQEFFRAKLSGNLTFTSLDYDWIVSRPFDFQFLLTIFISYNAGQSWTRYWRGTFWKTDCDFDDDAKTVSVKPTVLDQYNDILAGLDKEYNLIDLAPDMDEIQADKRPMIQVYVPGQSVIGCFLSGMWWEQDCEPVSGSEMVEISGGARVRKLEYYYHFAINKGYTNIQISGSMTPILPESVSGVKIGEPGKYFDFYVDGIHYYRTTDTNFDRIGIYDPNTGAAWWNERVDRELDGKYNVTVSPVSGTPAIGNVTLEIETIDVYSRFVCDTETVNNIDTYEIPDDDLVENNRNYHRVVGYYFPDTIYFSDELTDTPNQWGLYQPGEYYQPPYLYWSPELFPVARNAWGRVSVWFTFSTFDWIVEESGRQSFTIRHAYPIWSVLRVLLEQVAPNINFRANYMFSQFLYPYDSNPISGINFRLFITPKSNIVSAGYDQPAQKAPITLRDVFNMLRDCFRCYWFVDENDNLHIEHIQFFRNGGSYSTLPVIGVNLITQKVTRNNKPWAFARNKYKYDKPAMAARYQFGWMDDVTQLFEGFPIDIISKYVNPENIENIDIARFTSDIDYILLNPGAVSKDGFVLLGAIQKSGGYALPYYNFIIDGNDHILQNPYVAFCLLQQYYAYDMPAQNYAINGVQMVAIGTKRLKIQEINFPSGMDPDLQQLVRTELGNGTIEKLSLNLSSRNANATLKYDTE